VSASTTARMIVVIAAIGSPPFLLFSLGLVGLYLVQGQPFRHLDGRHPVENLPDRHAEIPGQPEVGAAFRVDPA